MEKFKLVDYTHQGRRNRSYRMDWFKNSEKVIEKRGNKWVAYNIENGITSDFKEFKTLKQAKAFYEGN